MSIINIKYPNSIIEVLDVSYNTTKIMHDTTGLGLNIFHNFNDTINSSAEIYSDSIIFNTSQIDGTKDYNQFGNNTIHRNTDSIGGIKRIIVQPSGINFINNQDGNNLTMSYNTSQLLTNQDYSISCSNLSLNASTIDLSGQVEFTTNPPHCYINPTLGNDLVNKGYVDSLVGQYSGGYNLYFNYSVTDGAYKSLGQSIVDVAQQTVVITTNGLLQPVASFVSSALGITEIPAGLWNVLLYGQIDSTHGDVHYSYKLYTYDGITENEIGASAISADINAINNPAAYIMNITLATPETITLTTKLVIRIFVQNVGSSSARTITTYFQNNYYSFTQSTLNAGTTLLSSNNTWTGTNNYSLEITAPIITVENNLYTPFLSNRGSLNIGTGSLTTSTTIGRVNASTNIRANTLTLEPSTTLQVNIPITPNYSSNALTGNTTGTIGQILNGSLISNNTNLTFTGAGAGRVGKINISSLTLPFGVWLISGSVICRCLTTSNLCQIECQIQPEISYTSFCQNFSTGSVNFTNWDCPVGTTGFYVSTSGADTVTFTIWIFASTGTWSIRSIARTWFKAVRIA
jgi:hypothetical protein